MPSAWLGEDAIVLRSPAIMRLLYQNSDAVTAVYDAFAQTEGGSMSRADVLRFARVRASAWRSMVGGVW